MTLHDTGTGHQECADRLRALLEMFEQESFSVTKCRPATIEEINRVHPQSYVDAIKEAIPVSGHLPLDGDTIVSAGSWEAALHAAGAVCQAVDDVLANRCGIAFCAVRPPGHHAETTKAMGFCLFNNVFIGARHAQATGKAKKIAIIDFDVHHGNGTEHMARKKEEEAANILYASTHEWPQFPGTGGPNAQLVKNIINVPLPRNSGSVEFRAAYEDEIFPALHEFKPDLLMISAGFDGHKDDPLASLQLTEDDYMCVTAELKKFAVTHCNNNIISVLEGGYNLDVLKSCVKAHLNALII